MNRLRTALILVLLLTHAPSSARTLAGVELAEQVEAAPPQPSLQLNGAAIRYVHRLVEAYVGALYLETTLTNPEEILGNPGQRRMDFHLLRTLSGRQLNEQLFEGLQLNRSPAELQALAEPIERLRTSLEATPRLRKGSILRFDYLPQREQTEISLDGRRLGVLAGKSMFDALLAHWVGEYPVSSDFKRGILGQP